MKKQRKKHVALLMESTRAYSRDVIRGIGQYNREHSGWIIDYSPRSLNDPPPSWLNSWKGDGILARINDERLLKAILATGVPAVDLRRMLSHPQIPRIGPNDEKVIQLLFDHYRNRGFYSFGFFGIQATKTFSVMQIRLQHFEKIVREAGLQFSSLRLGAERESQTAQAKGSERIHRWLNSLPKQTAIVACNDDMAFRLIQECRMAEIAVPDAIAIAGIGNDECFCELGNPSLTSVDLNPEAIGIAAASMLDKMMNTSFVPPAASFVMPRGVVVRSSTDTIATADQKLSLAIRFIRDHACEGITPSDVLRHVRLSRMTLEKRFKSSIHKTIHQEIVQVRLHHVKELLLMTELNFREIARETGFAYPEYMMRVFRQEYGMTLRQWRFENKKRT